MQPRAILFDLDGTLLDTAPDMVDALNELRREEHRVALPFDAVRGSVSHGAARLVKLAFPDAEPERFAALQTRYLEIYSAHGGRSTRLFAGMERVLKDIARRGLALGVVTNKPAWLTEPLLEELGIRGQFACVISGDTLPERKPHPRPLLHAAQLAGVAAGACLYVGDAERDIQAAHAAGMPSLVAAYGYLEAGEDWKAWGANGHIEHPLQLLDWLEGSYRA